jgi:hypothetical protein
MLRLGWHADCYVALGTRTARKAKRKPYEKKNANEKTKLLLAFKMLGTKGGV